jgi:hypothetical protein
MQVSPMLMLGFAFTLTAGAGVAARITRRRRRRALGILAREWGMHYSRNDVFDLAARVASRLPAPGAANVRVIDLIYGTEQAGYRYIFTAEYTVGVVRGKSRQRCVVSVLEPRGRTEEIVWTNFSIAPTDRPLIEQYRSLACTETKT